ncbi:MAG: ABC transporter permease [Rickettsiales bacterium]|nr:ABC transporter permease [Rickettsiales bacterium]
MKIYTIFLSILNFLQLVGRGSILFCKEVGKYSIFILNSLQYAFTSPFYFKQFTRALLEIGFFSVPVVGMTAIFTGAVLVLQSYTGFSRFSAESSIPTVVVLSITRELGPVLTGLMVAGRMGSSIAAEIATMKVTEQIDALTTLSVNPIKYLVTPRIIAGIVVFPLLVLIANSIGIMGGYIVATDVLSFNKVLYIRNTLEYLEINDVVSGIIKAVIFGLIVTLCGCYNGMSSKRGASGVGIATINAVVMSSILILFFNYVTTGILFSK